jgi:hypothetical protein
MAISIRDIRRRTATSKTAEDITCKFLVKKINTNIGEASDLGKVAIVFTVPVFIWSHPVFDAPTVCKKLKKYYREKGFEVKVKQLDLTIRWHVDASESESSESSSDEQVVEHPVDIPRNELTDDSLMRSDLLDAEKEEELASKWKKLQREGGGKGRPPPRQEEFTFGPSSKQDKIRPGKMDTAMRGKPDADAEHDTSDDDDAVDTKRSIVIPTKGASRGGRNISSRLSKLNSELKCRKVG